MAYTLDKLRGEYQRKWDNMIIIRPDAINRDTDKILRGKDTYESIAASTGVPWYVIGIIHLRESNCNFNTHLHNGDSLNRRTVHVPKGRPFNGTPPFSFEESAIDALEYDGYTKIRTWDIPQIAYMFEKYNGFGYRKYNVASPYLWAGSNQYSTGKYIRDGVFSAGTVDSQNGCMCILKTLLERNATVINPDPAAHSQKAPVEVGDNLPQVSRKAWWNRVLQWFFGAGSATAGTVSVLDATNLQATKTYLDVLKSFWSDYGILIALGALFAGMVITFVIQEYTKQDIKEGRYVPSKE